MPKRQDPSVIVGAFIFNLKGEIFVVKSSKKWSGKYLIPGGHVEYKERIEETVRRGVKEETNLDVDNIEFFGFSEIINPEAFHDQSRHFVALNFKCLAKNEDVILNEEAEEYLWVSLDKVLDLDLNSSTRLQIEKIINNN